MALQKLDAQRQVMGEIERKYSLFPRQTLRLCLWVGALPQIDHRQA